MCKRNVGTIPALTTFKLLESAAHHGIDVARAQKVVASATDVSIDDDTRISSRLHWLVWAELTRDPGFSGMGLALGALFRSEHLGVAGHLITSCQTLRHAASQLERYRDLLGELLPVLEEKGPSVRLSVTLKPVAARMHEAVDYAAAALYSSLQRLTGGSLSIREVRLQRPTPPDRGPYVRLFGRVPISFERAETALLFDASLLDARIPKADEPLRRCLAKYADECLARLPSPVSFVDQVKWIVSDVLHSGVPGAGVLASRLGVSVRSLQRRLQREGTNLKALVEVTRREQALLYLQMPNTSIGEVAFRLGYSEPSAFHRAFRRWTGQTPSSVREEASNRVQRVPRFPAAADRPNGAIAGSL